MERPWYKTFQRGQRVWDKVQLRERVIDCQVSYDYEKVIGPMKEPLYKCTDDHLDFIPESDLEPLP